ncbi:diacylglycerol kinase [Spiroplasma endosymbiont of Polydrusus formosus]|uniref:diacylglycerol kinase n=1 Tax=Spiroplasma endosymbiont of Polydrusus formosus TaxID=3139326 RepID=UPI0035B4FBFE
MNNNKNIISQEKSFLKLQNNFSNDFQGIYTAIKEKSSLIIHFIVSLVIIGIELINTMVENFVDLLSFDI